MWPRSVEILRSVDIFALLCNETQQGAPVTAGDANGSPPDYAVLPSDECREQADVQIKSSSPRKRIGVSRQEPGADFVIICVVAARCPSCLGIPAETNIRTFDCLFCCWQSGCLDSDQSGKMPLMRTCIVVSCKVPRLLLLPGALPQCQMTPSTADVVYRQCQTEQSTLIQSSAALTTVRGQALAERDRLLSQQTDANSSAPDSPVASRPRPSQQRGAAKTDDYSAVPVKRLSDEYSRAAATVETAAVETQVSMDDGVRGNGQEYAVMEEQVRQLQSDLEVRTESRRRRAVVEFTSAGAHTPTP